uniref:Polymerase nucleotidyl transferase domain-containing protein n=1 Tax=Ditylenchus dipsaci TaxID=166011 RepID=A0A915DRR9_9BILA
MLQKEIKKNFHVDAKLYITGSSLNGFGNDNSDMDLCLIYAGHLEGQRLVLSPITPSQRFYQMNVLSEIEKALINTMMNNINKAERNRGSNIIKSLQLIRATVPILRIHFHGAFEGMQVDINVNNPASIDSTNLLYYYSILVKEWAKSRGINSAFKSSLSSYSWVLMVFHYLQSGTTPPVLPVMKDAYKQEHSRPVENMNMDGD